VGSFDASISWTNSIPSTSSVASKPRRSISSEERLSREQRRSRRKRAVRARTISVKRLSIGDIDSGSERWKELEAVRPKTRSECAEGPRPCPHVSCRHHLYLDVSPKTGAIKLNFPDLEVWEMSISCALDVADDGATTLEDVGAILNLTRERIRQLELKALTRLEAVADMKALREFFDPNYP
jgi:hypothetical protein